MKKIIITVISLCCIYVSGAQSIDKIINPKAVKRIEKKLSSDAMQGRRTFTPGIEKASAFIEKQFKKAGLQTFNGSPNYRQEFFMYESKNTAAKIIIDGKSIPDSLVVVFSYQPQVALTEKNEVEIVKISTGDKFGPKFFEYYQGKKNLLVLVDTSFKSRIKRMKEMDRVSADSGNNTVVFVFGIIEATTFSIDLTNTIEKKSFLKSASLKTIHKSTLAFGYVLQKCVIDGRN